MLTILTNPNFDLSQPVGAGLSLDTPDVLLQLVRPVDDTLPLSELITAQPDVWPDREPYFEIYYAERISLTSILFSGGDWRWRFCSATGEAIASSLGYRSKQTCEAAVTALRKGAGSASIRSTP
ncbi:DUF1508 domain-containing protein [Sphingomonas sp. KR3-1]|uniref:YegP family protein n=1 Tax=Sphingomonas sp. KR3-1 TaxID=3156611 RepID=UPI0032B5230B